MLSGIVGGAVAGSLGSIAGSVLAGSVIQAQIGLLELAWSLIIDAFTQKSDTPSSECPNS